MSAIPFMVRCLGAIWWIAFAVSGAAVWGVHASDIPWWAPFAISTATVAVFAGALFIISGPKIFSEP